MAFIALSFFKLPVLLKHCQKARDEIAGCKSVDDSLFLMKHFYAINDINRAFRFGLAINPFKWSFKHYFPRLAAELDRRAKL